MNDASHPLTSCHMTLGPGCSSSQIKPLNQAELFLDVPPSRHVSGWRENILEEEIRERDSLNALKQTWFDFQTHLS